MIAIKTLADLTAQLDSMRQLDGSPINYQAWGTNGSKKLEHLLDDVLKKEIVFGAGRTQPVMFIRPAVVNVFYCPRGREGPVLDLIEDRHEFPDGSIFRRPAEFGRGLAEKSTPGEHPIDTAKRGLEEELGFPLNGTYILKLKVHETLGPMDCDVYPGVPTLFIRHIFECEIDHSLYKPEGYIELKPDGRKIFFTWIERGSKPPAT